MKREFPNSIEGENYKITSPHDTLYNCFAWSLNIDNRFIWPDADHIFAWPNDPDLPRNDTLEVIIRFFQKINFEVTQVRQRQADFHRIAIYCNGNTPTHLARQLPDGKWTSKLGESIDIEHTLEALEDGNYGQVKVIMARHISKTRPLPELHPRLGLIIL